MTSFSDPPDAAGGTQPGTGASGGLPGERAGETGSSGADGLSPLERLVAARQAEKQAQRKRDSRLLALLAAIVVIIAGGVVVWLRVDEPAWLHSTLVGTARSAQPTPTAPPVKLASPVIVNGPPADPFAGVPADGWANGAAAITIPAARAHGRYTAAQVRSAYQATRRLMIAAGLDWPTLRGGKPTAFANLLTGQERAQLLVGLNTTALNKDGTEQNTRTWVSSFAPGSTQFVTSVIKVKGLMSASIATDSGTEVLRITVDYLFVYAVEPPGLPADWTRIVQQTYGSVDFAQWDDPGGPLEPWVSVGESTAGARCDARDGYIHPDFPQGPPSSVQPSGPAVDPYSLATPATSGNCQSVTRT